MSIVSFEGLLVFEVLLEIWDVTGRSFLASASMIMHLFTGCGLAGDGFFVFQVLAYKHKAWVGKLLVPYFFFFATACLVSLYSMVIKSSVSVGHLACAPSRHCQKEQNFTF